MWDYLKCVIKVFSFPSSDQGYVLQYAAAGRIVYKPGCAQVCKYATHTCNTRLRGNPLPQDTDISSSC